MSLYYDLSITYTEDVEELKSLVLRAKNIGYNVVAVDLTVHLNEFDTKVNPVKRLIQDLNLTNNKDEDINSEFLSQVVSRNSRFSKFQVLSRITLIIDEKSSNKLGAITKDTIFNSYDLTAVKIKSKEELDMVINSLNTDIVSLSLNTYLHFHFKHSTVEPLNKRQKNMFFEVQYAPVLIDAWSRPHWYNNVKALTRAFHGVDNLFLSSGATETLHLRSPHDLTALATYSFELNQALAKNMVSQSCKRLISRAINRRDTYQSVVLKDENFDLSKFHQLGKRFSLENTIEEPEQKLAKN